MNHRMHARSGHWIWVLALSVTGGVALVGCGSGGHSPVSPRVLVLKRSDVPGNFTPSKANTHFVSTKQDAKTTHIKAAELAAKGRVNGYEAQYQRSDLAGRTSLPSGVLIIDSNVSTWKDAAGAAWGFSKAERLIKSSKTFHLTPVTTAKIGDQSLSFETKLSSSGLSFTSETLAFRLGQYTATTTVVGAKNKVKTADVLHYARLLEGRIEKVVRT